MAFNYLGSRETANRLLANFGQTATLRVVSVGSYDEEEGSLAMTSTDVEVTVVLLEYSLREKAAGLVQTGDVKALVAVGDLTTPPRQEDKLLVDGVEYKVVSRRPLSPAGVDVFYTLQLRK